MELKKTEEDWNKDWVKVENGSSIGARVICISPVKFGRWSMVTAGSVVTKEVLIFSLVAGNLPSRLVGLGKVGLN